MVLNDVSTRNKELDKIALKLFRQIGINFVLFLGIIKKEKVCCHKFTSKKYSDTYVSALFRVHKARDCPPAFGVTLAALFTLNSS